MSTEELEILRKKARNVDIIGTLIIILITITIFILLIPFGKPWVFFIFIAASIGVTLPFLNIRERKVRDFTLAFKKTFVLKALNSVFNDLVYEPEKGLEKSSIEKTEIVDMGNIYWSNDFISGKYKNIKVTQADVNIEYKYTDNDNHSHYTTLFKGRWMIFDFNKTFKSNIQVIQKTFGNSKENNKKFKTKYKRVMMEDQEFNNNFKIYALDEHEAFYILTPSLMEKIKNLTNSIDGKLLYCFVDNKLHIGVHNNKDSFEYKYGIYTEINEKKVIDQISQDIKLITDFVDKLNLDNDLFREEV